ncbi:MAG TPA: hypothetical protein VMH80_26905 [Bryobacteraceae bacterium]|nr:hypothetical protein [Bryobacteraceae bacterium]
MTFWRALLMLLSGLTATVSAQQAAQAVIDNQWVHVVRLKQGAHEKSTIKETAPAVLVYLTDVHQRVTGVDGKTHVLAHKAGEVAYLTAPASAEENLSGQATEAVLIELKPGAPKSPPVALDPVKIDPAHHIVLLDNDRVRAFRTVLEPHLKGPEHEHPHYVVVYLTELHTTMKLAGGRTIDNRRQPGEIAWRDPLKHITENIGDHTAMEIQVEIK